MIITAFCVLGACKTKKTFVLYKNASINLGDKGIVDTYKLYLNEGESFVLITPSETVKDGKKFVGWSDEENNHYIPGERLKMGKSSKTFTAVWMTAYTFDFLKGAEGVQGDVPATMYYAEGEVFNLPKNTFTREGYRFDGWTKTGESQLFLEYSKYTVENQNVEFNAAWTRVYSVKFISGSPNASGNAPIVSPREYGQSIKLPQNSFRSSGFDFVCWTINGDDYNVGDNYVVTGDVTFSAKWVISSTTSDDKFEYTLNPDNNSYRIAKAANAQLPQNLVLPATYNGKPITEIANKGFYRSSTLLSVIIPNSITKIGAEAFSTCANLETVILADDNNLNQIGGSAFKDCVKLSTFGLISQDLGTLNLPDAVTVLEEYVFYNCNFTKINISDKLTEIKTCALSLNLSLTSFEVNSQSQYFRGITALTDKDITNLYAYALAAQNESFSTGNITHIKPYAFSGAKNLKTVTFGTNLTNVGAFAFADCSNLTTINQDQTANNKLVTVGESAFQRCGKLESFYFGKSLTNIDISAFFGCYKLGEYLCDEDNPYFSVYRKDWYNKDRTRLIAYAPNKSSTVFDLPDTVEVIGSYAFAYSKVTQVTAASEPDLRIIEDYAFEGCSALTSFYNFSFLTSIGDHAFEFCSSLKAATLGSDLSYLGKNAFYFCRNLTTLNIADDCKLTEISEYAFGESGLTSLTISGTITTLQKGAFNGCANLVDINLGNVTTIKEDAFRACYGLSAITIPASVTVIESTAFIDCTKLNAFTVQAGNEYFAVDNGNLYNKDFTKLINVAKANPNNVDFVLPATVTEIGDYAFYKVRIITFSTAENSVLAKIGKSAFEYCSYLQSAVVPASLTTVSEKAFYDCALLSSFTFTGDQNLQTIDSLAFGNCVKLKLVLSGINIPTVDASAFSLSAQAQQSSFRPKIYVQNSLVDYLKSEWSFIADYLYPLTDLDN